MKINHSIKNGTTKSEWILYQSRYANIYKYISYVQYQLTLRICKSKQQWDTITYLLK